MSPNMSERVWTPNTPADVVETEIMASAIPINNNIKDIVWRMINYLFFARYSWSILMEKQLLVNAWECMNSPGSLKRTNIRICPVFCVFCVLVVRFWLWLSAPIQIIHSYGPVNDSTSDISIGAPNRNGVIIILILYFPATALFTILVFWKSGIA